MNGEFVDRVMTGTLSCIAVDTVDMLKFQLVERVLCAPCE